MFNNMNCLLGLHRFLSVIVLLLLLPSSFCKIFYHRCPTHSIRRRVVCFKKAAQSFDFVYKDFPFYTITFSL